MAGILSETVELPDYWELSSPAAADGALRALRVRAPARERKTLLGFEWHAPHFVAFPQLTFRPRGLMVWGDDLENLALEQAVIGANEQVLVSSSPVPARFFATGKSYEQLAALMADGFEPACWPDFKTVDLGCSVRVRFRAPRAPQVAIGPERVQLCMWGFALEI